MSEPTLRDAGPVAGSEAVDVLIVVGDGRLSTVELDGRDLVIGRGAGCDVVVDHRALSRRHAILRVGPPTTVEDLDSTNGTRVRGELRRGGPPIALGAGLGFEIGPFAFLIVCRAGGDRGSTAGDPLRVLDPSPAGIAPVVREIARSGASILVLGETGVGKEVLATTLHLLSGRAGALARINCAALSESLLESELFGHERGAFTGAVAQHTGMLEAAEGGTVFLDEIGELSPSIQAKLLRAVEQREVVPLGATRPVALDVRFIAATNRDLLAEVEAGRFRRDLFFRLDGMQLVIPPLRERRAMIGRLALGFLDEARARANKPGLRLDDQALAVLQAHAWPGNVRELKAVIERAVLLAGEVIGVRQLRFARHLDERAADRAAAAPPARPAPSPARRDRAPADLSDEQQADRDLVLCALDESAGNQTRAAKRLGISRTTLITKLRLYRVPRPRA